MSKYIRIISISLNAVFPSLPDNPDVTRSLYIVWVTSSSWDFNFSSKRRNVLSVLRHPVGTLFVCLYHRSVNSYVFVLLVQKCVLIFICITNTEMCFHMYLYCYVCMCVGICSYRSVIIHGSRSTILVIWKNQLVAGRKNLQNKWEDHTPARGQESSASVPKGGLTARVTKEDKNDTEVPSPEIQKIDGANYKIDTTRTLCRCSKKKAGNTVEGHTQCRPRRKEGKNVDRNDRIDRIDSNKNTPNLRTLVTHTRAGQRTTSQRGKTLRPVQTAGDSKRWKKSSCCALDENCTRNPL